MPDYPVQVSKVQAPPLRDETLARDRLLDWLSVKIHRRAVLLTAEAGYGKTTLLADFTRRTRLRVLWFRLDRGDRDWTGFIAHLVAAMRIHVPDFAPSTRGLLRETATSAPSLETVFETFLRELSALPADPTAFVFDDFHLVDDSADIRHVVRELLTRGPERMSYVFASRREPPIRLARLRALGEVAELGTDDLRFDASETERLFRETYEMRLEPSLLAELNRRTEGWAASLQLVRAALHDRDPGQVRSFISSLSGAEGHLYEYLAEEVIGELPDDLQQFLMRTSVLETVDLTLGPVAAGISVEEATRLIEEGERHGLFGKGGPRARHFVRAHPLVHDFLLARLDRSIGLPGIRAIHMRVAEAARSFDWLVAARHFIDADAESLARQVIASALERVLATGAYTAAQELVGELTEGAIEGAPGLVLRSRLAVQRADTAEGLVLAEEASRAEPASTAALLNLVHARTVAGDVEGALEASERLERSGHSALSEIGRVFQRVMDASLRGSLDVAERELSDLAIEFHGDDQRHFLGVTLHNLSLVQTARNAAATAVQSADQAIQALVATSAGVEMVAARLAKAQALGLLGEIEDARVEVALAVDKAPLGQAPELALEIGQLEALFGEGATARQRVDESTRLTPDTDIAEQTVYARALVRITEGEYEAAAQDAALLRFGEPRTAMVFEARRHLLRGLSGLLLGDIRAPADLRVGTELATSQGGWLWANYGRILMELADPQRDPSSAVVSAAADHPSILGMVAEAVIARLGQMNNEAVAAVAGAAELRPWRWRAAVRRALLGGDHDVRFAAARILERIGDASDVQRLREAGRRFRGRHGGRLGYSLARRLAQPVLIEDLGRVRISRGSATTDGRDVRRKVLALLCLLLTRPRMALTREEVVDNLWPDHDPTSALNSLNQTVYFLRRVFEPDYSEELSPGYVGQDGETIWLDPELVVCGSRRCLEIIRTMPGEPTPQGALALAAEYTGRFALDFAYEDWASSYRDGLHAAYLRVMEHAIRLDMDSGHLVRATFLAERAAEADPDSEEIQLALTRIYRHSGAHAAAAEQYGHYAQLMTDLGVDPVKFEDL
jgi:ATP/maltotriose-dependent transcriptional regulator MalT/DNA-binding SARP family transcriptional activator